MQSPSTAFHAKLLYAALCLILTVVMVLELADAYHKANAAAEVRAENTGHLISEWLRSAFQLSDYLLRDVISHVDPDDLQFPHPDPARQAWRTVFLQRKMATLPHLTKSISGEWPGSGNALRQSGAAPGL